MHTYNGVLTILGLACFFWILCFWQCKLVSGRKLTKRRSVSP